MDFAFISKALQNFSTFGWIKKSTMWVQIAITLAKQIDANILGIQREIKF